VDRFRRPGLLLGLGMGGFVDGILIHQMLGWHHMLSGWYPLTSPQRMRMNMIGDGVFHAFCWLLVVAGILTLATAASWPQERARLRLTGWMIAGWGVFNVVEGIIDHLVLGIHHVHPRSQVLAYDLGFIAIGLALTTAGLTLARVAVRPPTRG
jgi:uncharacterized membrane protein